MESATHGTFFGLQYSVAVFSQGHGGQVSASPSLRFRSVFLFAEASFVKIND